MKKRIFSLLFLMCVLANLPVIAFAHDVPDFDRDDCTIDVVLWDNAKDKGIVGAELVCYRVGYVDHDGDQNYHFYDIITDEEIPRMEIYSTTTPSEFEYYAKKGIYKEEYKETFEKEGIYYFTKLPTGLYLVMQTKAAKGYSDMSPFLVSVPYMDDHGEYVYAVTAKVKTELEREIETAPPTTKPSYGNKLPQTGQLTWPIPWLASSGMVLFALGWWLCFGRRKDSYEN